jgi:hypothetical protein
MAKTKIEFEVDIPEGYEWTGECRKALRGELHLNNEGAVEVWEVSRESNYRYPILRKAVVWKQLTPEKAFEFMLAKKEVTLRHISWPSGKKIHKTITSVYRYNNDSPDLSIDLETQGLIKNTEYLETSDV